MEKQYNPYKKSGVLKESEEGKVFAQWLKVQRDMGNVIEYSKLQQDTWAKNFKIVGKARAEGVRPGVPDYLVVLKCGVFFIELKAKDGGQISNDQARWIFVLNERRGVDALVCKGADEAIAYIQKYIDWQQTAEYLEETKNK